MTATLAWARVATRRRLGSLWAWQLVAASVDSVSRPALPVATLLVAVPLVVLLANLLAAGPAAVAARLRAAAVLRAE